jgi:hypothetical protein
MSHPQSQALQKIIDDWQYFAPCLGANITVYDSNYGYSNFSSGFKSINPEQQLEVGGKAIFIPNKKGTIKVQCSVFATFIKLR